MSVELAIVTTLSYISVLGVMMIMVYWTQDIKWNTK